jgi:hypothetical protein
MHTHVNMQIHFSSFVHSCALVKIAAGQTKEALAATSGVRAGLGGGLATGLGWGYAQG